MSHSVLEYDQDAPRGAAYPDSEHIAVLVAGERAKLMTEKPGRPIIIWGGDRADRSERPSWANAATRGSWASNLTWTVVYKYFNEGGRLLYVGISNDPSKRHAEHLAESAFAPHAAMVHEQWFPTRSQALRAEAAQIERYCPPFNKERSSEPGGPRVQLSLDTPAGRSCHPHERHKRIASEIKSSRRRVAEPHTSTMRCWHCASAADLAVALEERSTVRAPFDPTVPGALCPRWSPKKPELPPHRA